MKATINGITVEGTPQEIAEYTKLLARRTVGGTSLACESVRGTGWYPYMPVAPNDVDWMTRTCVSCGKTHPVYVQCASAQAT